MDGEWCTGTSFQIKEVHLASHPCRYVAHTGSTWGHMVGVKQAEPVAERPDAKGCPPTLPARRMSILLRCHPRLSMVLASKANRQRPTDLRN